MVHSLTRFVLLCSLLFAWAAHADDLHFMQLHNRQADELIPVLQPLLDPSDAISGSGYQLIVRTSDERFVKIQSLVQQLDTAPQQLMISVRHQASSGDSSQGYSASGSVGTGTIQIGVDGRTSSRGGTITRYGSNGSGSLNVYHSQRQQSGSNAQRLMVLEGRWASIETGQSVPLQQQSVTQTPYGTQVQQNTEYVDATTGFDVRPRLNGDEVTLEIAPYQRHLTAEGIDTQSIRSTVRGRLGEWIEIGGANESSSASGSGTAQSSESQRSDVRSVWLKVELAN